jgi:hypothetical protein
MMIEYIRTINNERRQLSKNMIVITDLLGLLSIACGAALYITIYLSLLDSPYTDIILSFLDFSSVIFWISFVVGLLAFISIGQFIVIGLVTITLLFAGKLSLKESVRYTFLYRLPPKWLVK